jgi:signal transduction histidine kinase/CRP-like cAMP-binding protein
VSLSDPKEDGLVPRMPHLKTKGGPMQRVRPASSGAAAGLLKVLTSLALFLGVPQTSLKRLAKTMHPLEVPAGRIVFSQGDPAQEFFVLASGRVVVTVKGADPEGPPIAVLTGPTWFGDLAIVSDQPRISTVTAVTDCEFWVLSRREFEVFFNRHPRMARNLAAALIRRLQEKDRDFTNQSTLALERARLLEALRQGAEERAALTDVTQAINASLDLDRTLNSISTYAARLTKSDAALIFLYDAAEDVLAVRASYNAPAGYLSEVGERRPPRSAEPEVLANCSLTVRAVVERGPAQIADVEAAPLYRNRELLLRWGFRAVLVVPLLHDERVIGAMSVLRLDPGEFTKPEVELVTTFAGHSAIALEHARLFQEAQARNRALEEALEYQTCVSEFLKSISAATFELQPTLDVLAEHAARLCSAASCLIFTLEDGTYQLAADFRTPASFRRLLQDHPIRPGRDTMVGRTALERRPVHIPDVLADPEYQWGEAQRAVGYRSVLGVPLLQGNTPVGVIAIHRTEVQPFTRKEIEVLTSFADQAVFAIEKIRLFRELRARTDELAQSVEELRALGQTTQAVNSSLNRERVLSAIAEQACRLCQADAGLITEFVEMTGEFRAVATWNVRPEFVRKILESPPTWGKGVTGQSAAKRGAVQIPDVRAAEGYAWREAITGEGYRALLSVPLLRDERIIGTIAVARKSAGAFAERFVELLTTFANQASIALEHARLFQQLQEKATQLEVVSRHKSQFLASMSHELRTPLNAIIGFSEVLLDPSLGTLSDAERQEFLTNILTSGKHLLRLINDVLDLSKVEAGKMELQCEPVVLADVVEGVLGTVKALATRKHILVQSDVPPDLGSVYADPARLKQILYNLLSNAIKFTPEEGQVIVAARRVEGPRTRRGAVAQGRGDEKARAPLRFVEVSVTDTGVGISPAHQERIFEEFEQVPHPTRTPQEGTGLGLALVKKLVQMHGGTVQVTSTLGEGSTFAFTIPLNGVGGDAARSGGAE